MAVTTNKDTFNAAEDEEVRLPTFIPSRRPILENKKPQNAALDKLPKTNQLSTALVEIVATPPSKKLMDVTINSARKKTPPDDPII
mmetsp:Transcript_5285/g.7799  ORF Transcript_5285/g.7799 Transcript_5285/m.7799 type:complete len:86 (+) Transcript_5285:108-365(+)